MYGLLGKTLSHSFSPYIHEKLNPDITYNLYETETVGDFLRALPFKGLNVTIPYKQTVIPYLDNVEEAAENIGSVNTIVNYNGQLTGFNTDYTALRSIIKKRYPKSYNSPITILGNGATMRSVKFALRHENYHNITVCARNPKAGESLLEDIPEDTEIIINTTPVGMYPDVKDSVNVDFSGLKRIRLIHDLIYNPFQTLLMLQGKAHGARTMNGLELLVTQAYHSQKHFGLSPRDNLSEIMTAFRKEFMNIVFIGLPFSGKSHYGRELAKTYDKVFVDTDTLIEERHAMSTQNIFTYKGEDYFRSVEKDIVMEKAKEFGQILAPGGGVVLNEDAMMALKQNAFIIYLDMDDALLESSDLRGRPLIKSKNDWVRLKKERQSLYRTYADTVIRKDTMDESVIISRIEEALNAYFSD